MPTRQSADKAAAIEDVMSGLEMHLKRLNAAARSDVAADDFGTFDGVPAVTAKRRRSKPLLADDLIAGEAARLGIDLFKRALGEIEARPMAMLALAAGVGYLFGLSNRVE